MSNIKSEENKVMLFLIVSIYILSGQNSKKLSAINKSRQKKRN